MRISIVQNRATRIILCFLILEKFANFGKKKGHESKNCWAEHGKPEKVKSIDTPQETTGEGKNAPEFVEL